MHWPRATGCDQQRLELLPPEVAERSAQRTRLNETAAAAGANRRGVSDSRQRRTAPWRALKLSTRPSDTLHGAIIVIVGVA